MLRLKISQRSRVVIASPIRKFISLVRQAEEQGVRVYKLNVGDPDLATPPQFWHALRAYQPKTLNYAPSPGISEHVQAWAAYYASFGIKLTPAQILPTVGGAEAIMFALLAVTDPGDEVLVFEPLYSSYKGFAAMYNIKLVPLTLRVDNNFALPKTREMPRHISRRTKAIIVVNPNNPTGSCLTPAEHKRLLKIAERYRLFIIADETYREIVFQKRPVSFLKFPSAANHVIVVDSASKRFSLPGARIGCLVGHNPEVMDAALRFAMTRLSAPTLEQYGLIPLLMRPKGFTRAVTREYELRRNLVWRELQKIPGVTCYKPEGAFYLIAKLPVANAEKFVKWLITDFRDHGATILVTPAEDFYLTPGLGKHEIRLAYVLARPHLKRALSLLAKGLRAYAKRDDT